MCFILLIRISRKPNLLEKHRKQTHTYTRGLTAHCYLASRGDVTSRMHRLPSFFKLAAGSLPFTVLYLLDLWRPGLVSLSRRYRDIACLNSGLEAQGLSLNALSELFLSCFISLLFVNKTTCTSENSCHRRKARQVAHCVKALAETS